MVFLHVIPPSQRYMSGFMIMLQRYFNNSSEDVHKIMVHNEVFKNDCGLLLFDNVVHFPDMGEGKVNKARYIKKAFEEADRIVFHSFQPDDKWLLLCYLLKDYMSKAVWVIWGIDLYNYTLKSNSFAAKLKNKMGKELRERMRYPVVISEADIDIYNREFGTFPVVCAAYPFMDTRFSQMDRFKEKMNQLKEEYYQKVSLGELDSSTINYSRPINPLEDYDGRIRVLVGHNAYPFNRHTESIDMLERIIQKKGSEKIELCLPLSYGNTDLSKNVSYKDAIKQYAGTLKAPFQVTFLESLMSANEYTQFLSTVDIGIFNAHRQSGLGNILQLLYMGKKIYMARENPLFSFLIGKGFIIHDIEELKTTTVEEFIASDNVPSPNPWIKETRSIENVAKAWETIFSYVKGDLDAETALNRNLKYLGN